MFCLCPDPVPGVTALQAGPQRLASLVMQWIEACASHREPALAGGWSCPLSESYLTLIINLGVMVSQPSLGDSSGKGLHVLGSLWGRQGWDRN